MKKIIYRILSFLLKDFILHQIINEPRIIGPAKRLEISPKAYLNNSLVNLNSGKVIIHDHAFFGKNVSLLTGTHDVNREHIKRIENYPKEGRDIIVHKGVWVATGSIIIGPCEIGEGAVIAAGSVVTKNVDSHTIVGGNPAKVIKKLH